MQMIFLITAFLWSAAGAACDIMSRRIPNAVTYSGVALGIVLRTSLLGWQGLGTALAGGLIGGGIFFFFYLIRGMGGGDVKLMAALGCITGPWLILQIVTACALAGGVMAIAVMIYKKRAVRTIRNVGALLRFRFLHGAQMHPTLNIDSPESLRMPYGIAIAAGALYPLVQVLISR
ncbi:MAG: prepilin peptidase [Acidobacteriia bacterium]|nr:prepilin peptidase [Terriglobia bacterium]